MNLKLIWLINSSNRLSSKIFLFFSKNVQTIIHHGRPVGTKSSIESIQTINAILTWQLVSVNSEITKIINKREIFKYILFFYEGGLSFNKDLKEMFIHSTIFHSGLQVPMMYTDNNYTFNI